MTQPTSAPLRSRAEDLSAYNLFTVQLRPNGKRHLAAYPAWREACDTLCGLVFYPGSYRSTVYPTQCEVCLVLNGDLSDTAMHKRQKDIHLFRFSDQLVHRLSTGAPRYAVKTTCGLILRAYEFNVSRSQLSCPACQQLGGDAHIQLSFL